MASPSKLAAHQDYIVEHRKAGKTLTTIADLLEEEKQVSTTAGTLSRYLKDLGQVNAPPAANASPEQERYVETLALLVELTANENGHSQEQRVVIEHLAGKVGGMGERITALENVVNQPAANSGKNRIWPVMLFVSAIWLLFSVALAAAVYFYLRW